jgi:hypothetical protein
MEPREFYIAKEMRRAAWIIAGAYVLGAPLMWGLRWVLKLEPRPGWLAYWIIVPFLAAGLGCVYRFRLRIGPEGITRRFLLGWRKWTWDDFGHGRMEWGPGLHQLSRVPPRRGEGRLDLSFFGEEAIEVCEAAIARCWKPPEIEVPEEMRIEFPKFAARKTEARLDAAGIRLSKGGAKDFYPWEAVREVVIETLSPRHRDFVQLTVSLAERHFSLSMYQSHWPLYRGPGPLVVRRFVETHVPEDRILRVPWNGEPETLEAVERERARIRRQVHRDKRAMWIAGGLVFLCEGILMWVDRDQFKSNWQWALVLSLILFGYAAFVLLAAPKIIFSTFLKTRVEDLDKAERRLRGRGHGESTEERGMDLGRG